MLSPEYYDSCADVLLAHYARLEDDIICDIIRRLMKTGNMTDTAKHQAESLQQAGLLYEDIIRIISARTDATAKQVQTVFEDAGVETVEIDNQVYRDMGKVPVDIRQSDAMRQVLEAGFKKTLGEVQNLTLTTAVTSQTAYKAACNSAYMQVSSGAFDYQTAIRNAVRQAAAQGVRVLYPSGHVSQLDVAVRCSVLTGIGQTCREIGLANADENDCDLMEITAHGGARPEHAKWQGQLVSRSGKLAGKVIDGMRVYSLREIGYGDVRGFGGANCRHDWYPYFPGYSTPNYTERELEKLNERSIEYNGEKYTQYEVSQMQRAGERKVRALKREAVAYDTAAKNAPDSATELEMKNAFQATSVKLKDAEKQLSDFCKETGQDRDRFREQALGFGRSQAQRAVRANKTETIRKSIEETYGTVINNALTEDEKHDIIKNRNSLSNRSARKWYLDHDSSIPDLIDRSRSTEEQARQAFELRNGFRTIARDLMKDVELRKELDATEPNKSFEELIQSKMERKNMTRIEAIEDILGTASKTRKSVNKSLGLE